MDRINHVLPPPTQAFSWMQSWESFLWVLNLEKTINFFPAAFHRDHRGIFRDELAAHFRGAEDARDWIVERAGREGAAK